jgi:hypothetical protein
MSTFLGAWDIQPGHTLDDLIAEAEAQLPSMLAEAGAELTGERRWRIALVMTAPAVDARGVAPYERREAWADDMMPELGWRPEWDRVAA